MIIIRKVAPSLARINLAVKKKRKREPVAAPGHFDWPIFFRFQCSSCTGAYVDVRLNSWQRHHQREDATRSYPEHPSTTLDNGKEITEG